MEQPHALTRGGTAPGDASSSVRDQHLPNTAPRMHRDLPRPGSLGRGDEYLGRPNRNARRMKLMRTCGCAAGYSALLMHSGINYCQSEVPTFRISQKMLT